MVDVEQTFFEVFPKFAMKNYLQVSPFYSHGDFPRVAISINFESVDLAGIYDVDHPPKISASDKLQFRNEKC